MNLLGAASSARHIRSSAPPCARRTMAPMSRNDERTISDPATSDVPLYIPSPPHPELRRLDRLVGSWTARGSPHRRTRRPERSRRGRLVAIGGTSTTSRRPDLDGHHGHARRPDRATPALEHRHLHPYGDRTRTRSRRRGRGWTRARGGVSDRSRLPRPVHPAGRQAPRRRHVHVRRGRLHADRRVAPAHRRLLRAGPPALAAGVLRLRRVRAAARNGAGVPRPRSAVHRGRRDDRQHHRRGVRCDGRDHPGPVRPAGGAVLPPRRAR